MCVRVYTDVHSDVCKCQCRMLTGFPANVDRNVENISIYHGKKSQKKQNHTLERCRILCWYICIHTYIHTHTHPQKGSFLKHFHEKSCKSLETDSKKCQCRLKRPANVKHMSMSMVPPNVDPIWSISVYTLKLVCFFVLLNRYWGIVCVSLFYWTNIGESLCTFPGLGRERAKGDALTIRDCRRPPNLTLSFLR